MKPQRPHSEAQEAFAGRFADRKRKGVRMESGDLLELRASTTANGRRVARQMRGSPRGWHEEDRYDDQ
jgi:hypothetical protein